MNDPVEQLLKKAPDDGEHIQVLLDLIQEFIVLKDGDGRWLLSNRTVIDAYELQGVDYRGKTDRELAENMNDIISMLNPDGSVRYCSPSFLNILGYTVDEGSSIFEFLHLEDSSAVGEGFRELLSGDSDGITVQFRYAHAGGHYLWFETVLSRVLNEEGDVDHVVSVARVITERKEYEARLQRMAYYDALTGVPNRRSFMDVVKKLMGGTLRDGTTLGVLYLDIDHFKHINDTYGMKQETSCSFSSRGGSKISLPLLIILPGSAVMNSW